MMWPTTRLRSGLKPRTMGGLGSGEGPFIELDKPPASGLWGSVGRAGREVWVATEGFDVLDAVGMRLL